MKILFVQPFSGEMAAVRQKNLARALAARGHDLTLVLPRRDKYSGFRPVVPEPAPGVRVIHPPQFSVRAPELAFLPFLPWFLTKFAREKFDLIHAFRPAPPFSTAAAILARAKKIPFFLEFGDLESEIFAALGHPGPRVALFRAAENFAAGRAAGLTAMTRIVAQNLGARFPGRPVRVIPNGVDAELFSPGEPGPDAAEIRAEIGVSAFLLFVGKLDHASHLRILTAGLAKLPREIGLVVVGDGAGRADLEKWAAADGVAARVKFLGRVPHRGWIPIARGATALVAPLLAEPGVEGASNLKLFEFLALGRPVVFSGGAETAHAAEAGGAWVFPSGDGEKFAAAIRAIFRDPEAADRRAAAGRAVAVREHDWPIRAEILENFYREVLTKNPTPAKILGMKKTIGVIGAGFVGRAYAEVFSADKVYDKFKNFDLFDDIATCDVIFLAVPTDGATGGYEYGPIRENLARLSEKKFPGAVVIKSTIAPGATDDFSREFPDLRILFSPEFLRQRCAAQDLREGKYQIIGVPAGIDEAAVRDFFTEIDLAGQEKIFVPAVVAELVKTGKNSFLAALVVLWNQLFDAATARSADFDLVKNLILRDERIPGYGSDIFFEGFRGGGGYCLPKDLHAFLVAGKAAGADLPVFAAIEAENDRLLGDRRSNTQHETR